jgi:hypothetical protein
MSIIITFRRSYFPMLEGLLEITPLKFDNYGYYLFMKDTIVHVLLCCTWPIEGKLPVIS